MSRTPGSLTATCWVRSFGPAKIGKGWVNCNPSTQEAELPDMSEQTTTTTATTIPREYLPDCVCELEWENKFYKCSNKLDKWAEPVMMNGAPDPPDVLSPAS